MVERIKEQQEAINVVLSNDRKASHLILNWQQKDVLEAIDKVLSPLKKMTDLLSAEDYVTISAIKPMVEYICSDLLADDASDTALTNDMRRNIRNDLEHRYSNPDVCLLVNIASFLDPRFKVDYLNDDEFALVKEEITMGVICCNQTQEMEKSSYQVNSDDSCTEDEPPKKKLKKGELKLGTIFKKMKEKAQSPSSSIAATRAETMTTNEKLESEVDHFRKLPTTDPESNPLDWWKVHHEHYPLLATMAKKYLSISATNCPSERLFSSSGKVVTSLRNNLTPEKVNMLVFLSKNWK